MINYIVEIHYKYRASIFAVLPQVSVARYTISAKNSELAGHEAARRFEQDYPTAQRFRLVVTSLQPHKEAA